MCDGVLGWVRDCLCGGGVCAVGLARRSVGMLVLWGLRDGVWECLRCGACALSDVCDGAGRGTCALSDVCDGAAQGACALSRQV